MDNTLNSLPIINLEKKGEYIQYNDFIKRNNLVTSGVNTIKELFCLSKNILKYKTNLNEYFNNIRNHEGFNSLKEKDDINNISYCHNTKGIIFLIVILLLIFITL